MEELPDLRVQRPYASLEDYLEGDFWTVERKEMFLIGAPSFDLGVAIRFTIELDDGTAVVTGEGRVVEYTAPSEDFPGGLKVRFRQLDSESKAVLRRALEARRRAYQAAAEGAPEAPPTTATEPRAAEPIAPAELLVEPPRIAHLGARLPSSLMAPPKPRGAMSHRVKVVSPPPNRDVLLGRLRDRARGLAAHVRYPEAMRK